MLLGVKLHTRYEPRFGKSKGQREQISVLHTAESIAAGSSLPAIAALQPQPKSESPEGPKRSAGGAPAP